jgi:hypothetical protein
MPSAAAPLQHPIPRTTTARTWTTTRTSMFSWFRRWFPDPELAQLRETVVSLQHSETCEKLRLEDRLVAAQQDRDRLWESFQQSLQGERTAYQLHINHQHATGGRGYSLPRCTAHSAASGATIEASPWGAAAGSS